MLEVSALHAYYGRAHILDDVTFTVGWGEAVQLRGQGLSGAFAGHPGHESDHPDVKS